ncbi:tail protein I [Vibrio phage phi 2]|nr:tail protein I [Vibrio phage phi 2]
MSNKEQIKIIDITPESLKQDEQILAMCEALQPQMDDVDSSIPIIEIYSRIDELPEPILRMLAVENRVFQNEWELALTIEAKRNLVKSSFFLNKTKGTRASIERIFSLLNITASIQEWFEYGGDPFWFKVSIYDIEGRGLTESELQQAVRMINRYKPLRCRLDSIDASVKAEDVVVNFAAAVSSSMTLDVLPE